LSGSALADHAVVDDEHLALCSSTVYEWDTGLIMPNSVTYDLRIALGEVKELRYGSLINPHYPPSFEY
jgi:hypothetical protein